MEHKFLCGNRGDLGVIEFRRAVRLQSEKRQEWIQEIRGDTLQGIIERAGSAPHLANSSAASFPGKNECQGTHCGLIVKETVPSRSAKEFELKGKMEERKKREEKWQTIWCCQDQRRSCRMAQALVEKLIILSWLKRKMWPQCHKVSGRQGRQSRL